MATGYWSMPLFSFCLHSLVILLVVVNFCVVHVDFRRRFFRKKSHLVRKIGAESRRRFFGADFVRRFLECVISLRLNVFNALSLATEHASGTLFNILCQLFVYKH